MNVGDRKGSREPETRCRSSRRESGSRSELIQPGNSRPQPRSPSGPPPHGPGASRVSLLRNPRVTDVEMGLVTAPLFDRRALAPAAARPVPDRGITGSFRLRVRSAGGSTPPTPRDADQSRRGTSRTPGWRTWPPPPACPKPRSATTLPERKRSWPGCCTRPWQPCQKRSPRPPPDRAPPGAASRPSCGSSCGSWPNVPPPAASSSPTSAAAPACPTSPTASAEPSTRRASGLPSCGVGRPHGRTAPVAVVRPRFSSAGGGPGRRRAPGP